MWLNSKKCVFEVQIGKSNQGKFKNALGYIGDANPKNCEGSATANR